MTPFVLTLIVVASAALGGLVSYGILLLAFRGLSTAAAKSEAYLQRELERERSCTKAAEERLRSYVGMMERHIRDIDGTRAFHLFNRGGHRGRA